MGCKNICLRLDIQHINVSYKRFSQYKKCRTCCISIKTKANICPCCGIKLSVRRIHKYENRVCN
jgi:hypothetical protein